MATPHGDGQGWMGEWPDGWFRDGEESDASGAADKTVNIPAGGEYANPAGQYPVRQQDAWPAQPPISSAGGGWDTAPGGVAAPPGSPAAPGGPRWRGPRLGGWRRWLRPRRVITVVVLLIAVLLAGTVGMYAYLNSKLHRANILADYSGRPATGAGTNWLIVGSPALQGMSQAEAYRLSLGNDPADGTDTIMVLHLPANGSRPVLVSVPRDSYVHIPGHGYNKIDAAWAFGGGKLLAQTVQDVTGLYISHFMTIGYGGFVRVVNDVGGVRMCLPNALRDVASGVSLKKGCQTLTGAQALAYVRDRHSFVTQDLQREQDQRVFLKALLQKMTSTGVMLNPFAILPASVGVADALTVDQGTSLLNLYGVAKALRDPITTTVPIANANYLTPAGDAVQWSSSAQQLWKALRTDTKIPKNLITGSIQA